MAYRVSIALVPAADGSVAIRGSCTCPVGYNCKHVAALLIESMARPGPTRAAAAPAQAPAAPPPVTLPNEATAWLADLDREMALSEDAYPPTVQQRLMYVLDAAADRRGRVVVTLELASVRLRKDGSFSERSYRFAIHTVNSPTPPKYLVGSDLAILKRIDLLPSLYGFGERARYGLFGEPGAEMLERILRTGRCRWESATGPLMSQGEPRQARIGWTLTENGTLAPTIAIDAGGIAVPCWPLWYVDPQAFTCGVLETDLPPRVAVALLRAPPVEPRHVPILREKLAERLGEHSELLPAEPAPAEQVPGPPVPVLQLKRRPMTEPESWYWPGSERTDRQVAQLAFAYGPFVLDPGERRDQPLVARGERLYAIERDPAAEIGFRNRLHRDTGLVLRGSRSGGYLPPDARDDLVLAEDDDLAWARFMADVVPRLESEGWRIEVEAGFGPALAEASGDIGAKISEGSGIDWFEFEVGVTVDGERLNLLPQLVSLLRQGEGAGGREPAARRREPVRAPAGRPAAPRPLRQGRADPCRDRGAVPGRAGRRRAAGARARARRRACRGGGGAERGRHRLVRRRGAAGAGPAAQRGRGHLDAAGAGGVHRRPSPLPAGRLLLAAVSGRGRARRRSRRRHGPRQDGAGAGAGPRRAGRERGRQAEPGGGSDLAHGQLAAGGPPLRAGAEGAHPARAGAQGPVRSHRRTRPGSHHLRPVAEGSRGARGPALAGADRRRGAERQEPADQRRARSSASSRRSSGSASPGRRSRTTWASCGR